MNTFESGSESKVGAVSSAQGQHKKPYTAPRLVQFGDVRTLTESIGNGNVFDGLSNKTQ